MSKNILDAMSESTQLKIEELCLEDKEMLATALIFAMAELEAEHTYSSTNLIDTPEKAQHLLEQAGTAATVMIKNIHESLSEFKQWGKH